MGSGRDQYRTGVRPKGAAQMGRGCSHSFPPALPVSWALLRVHMFGLGIIEAGIILVLAYFALRRWVLRRYPRFYRAIDIVLFTTVALMLLFGVISQTSL